MSQLAEIKVSLAMTIRAVCATTLYCHKSVRKRSHCFNWWAIAVKKSCTSLAHESASRMSALTWTIWTVALVVWVTICFKVSFAHFHPCALRSMVMFLRSACLLVGLPLNGDQASSTLDVALALPIHSAFKLLFDDVCLAIETELWLRTCSSSQFHFSRRFEIPLAAHYIDAIIPENSSKLIHVPKRLVPCSNKINQQFLPH